jgi:hypothetical protein
MNTQVPILPTASVALAKIDVVAFAVRALVMIELLPAPPPDDMDIAVEQIAFE